MKKIDSRKFVNSSATNIVKFLRSITILCFNSTVIKCNEFENKNEKKTKLKFFLLLS
jgi:hypothetical protein